MSSICDPSLIRWCVSGSWIDTLFDGEYGFRGTHNNRDYYRLCGDEYLYWDKSSSFWALSTHLDDTSPMAYCGQYDLSSCTAGKWVSGTHQAADTLTITSGECHTTTTSTITTTISQVQGSSASASSNVSIALIAAGIVAVVIFVMVVVSHRKSMKNQIDNEVNDMHSKNAATVAVVVRPPNQNGPKLLSTDRAPDDAYATDQGQGADYNYVAPSAPDELIADGVNIDGDTFDIDTESISDTWTIERKTVTAVELIQNGPKPLSTDRAPNDAYATDQGQGADYNYVAPSAPDELPVDCVNIDGVNIDGEGGAEGVEGVANVANNEQHSEIKQWFNTAVNLKGDNEAYFRTFIDYGYDDMSLIKEITETELNKMGITKMAHQNRILSAIKTIVL